MPEKRWKAHERRAARRFGGERALQEGREGPDFETSFVIGSVKSRERLPRWITEALDQVRGYAKPLGNKLPVLCLMEKGRRAFIVAVHINDFEQWFGDLIPHDAEEE